MCSIHKQRMSLHHIILLFLIQFEFINSKDSACGCNLSRSKINTPESYYSFLSVIREKNVCLLSRNMISYENQDEQKEAKMAEGIDSWKLMESMVLIPAGTYQLGTDDIVIPTDREGPMRMVELKSFYMDKYEVSNREFYHYATVNNYVTEAEHFGDSFVFELFLNSTYRQELKDFRVAQALWWYKVPNASFKNPFGNNTDLADLLDHPVVHVSWLDASKYCAMRGARLPTEAEWEAACRGGHRGTRYPWGDKLLPGQKHMANIWQGTFPHYNSAKDGYVATCPVDAFPPNDFGLYNMAGNVWEWVSDHFYKDRPTERVKKGGSYLCHRDYCYRYRCSARSHNTEDSTAGNLGFRCAKDVD